MDIEDIKSVRKLSEDYEVDGWIISEEDDDLIPPTDLEESLEDLEDFQLFYGTVPTQHEGEIVKRRPAFVAAKTPAGLFCWQVTSVEPKPEAPRTYNRMELTDWNTVYGLSKKSYVNYDHIILIPEDRISSTKRVKLTHEDQKKLKSALIKHREKLLRYWDSNYGQYLDKIIDKLG